MAEQHTQGPAAPRLLVFDLDGTLIDSSLDLCNSVNAALAHVGKPQLPNALIASYIGDGAAMLVRRAIGDPGDLDALHPSDSEDLLRRTYEYFLGYYREHKLDNTRCYDGVLEALSWIRGRHPLRERSAMHWGCRRSSFKIMAAIHLRRRSPTPLGCSR